MSSPCQPASKNGTRSPGSRRRSRGTRECDRREAPPFWLPSVPSSKMGWFITPLNMDDLGVPLMEIQQNGMMEFWKKYQWVVPHRCGRMTIPFDRNITSWHIWRPRDHKGRTSVNIGCFRNQSWIVHQFAFNINLFALPFALVRPISQQIQGKNEHGFFVIFKAWAPNNLWQSGLHIYKSLCR